MSKLEVRIRPAELRDVADISRIYNASVIDSVASYAHEPEPLHQRILWLADHQAKSLPILVATDLEDKVLGWSSLSPFHSRTGFRFTVEDSVYVDASARGQGVGRKLLEPLIHSARDLGFHCIVAAIDGSNLPSLQLHASLGFVQAGKLAQVGFKFDRWLDLVYMQHLISTTPNTPPSPASPTA